MRGSILTGQGPGAFLLVRLRCGLAIYQDEVKVSRPRVADDFAAIRARMEELQRERAQMGASGQDDREKLRTILTTTREQQLTRSKIVPILQRRLKK
jgi:hypothetical protein